MTIEDPIEFLHGHKSCHRQPARGRRGHPLVRQRAQARAAPGPRHHPGRRDARPGDHLGGPHRGGDRSPGVRDPAHPGRRADHRPRDRRLPAHQQQQVRDAARRHASGRRLPDAAARARTAGAAWPRPRCWWRPRPSATSSARARPTRSTPRCRPGATHGMHTLDQHLAELVRIKRITLRDRPGEVPPRRGLQPPRRPEAEGERTAMSHRRPRRSSTRSGTAPGKMVSGRARGRLAEAAGRQQAASPWATPRSPSPRPTPG